MSKIEWTDKTWNPTIGCTPISPGCANCYAMKMAKRCVAMGQEVYRETLKIDHGGKVLPKWSGVVKLMHNRLDAPRRWRKPCRVFIDSMSDLFHESVPDDFIYEVFAVMEDCSRHTFQVLTKRAERMSKFVNQFVGTSGKYGAPDNVWCGVSVEDEQRYAERVRYLLKVQAKVRWLSCEPLLGPLSISPSGLWGLNWVVVGGESGPGHRPMEADWARAIRDRCLTSRVPFLFKQWGGARPGGNRELDGVVWDQYPKAKE
jgi:protein gp37